MRRTPDIRRHRAPSRPRDRRHDRARAIFGIADMMAGATAQIPPNISSQATTTQTLSITGACTMTAKLWGAGGGGFDPFNPSSPRGGGGGFATATYSLLPGDIVTYAAGGRGLSDGSGGGSSGSGTRNGGQGPASGGGATELHVNGVPVLLAGGGGGASNTAGGGGGGENGQDGAWDGNTATAPARGGTQTSVGAGGINSYGHSGQPGSGGNGGSGYYTGTTGSGGGGGGGYRGGGGGFTGGEGLLTNGPGGGGSGYDSTGSGTLTAAANWQAANNSDPDWTGNAGNAEVSGLVVLKFAPV